MMERLKFIFVALALFLPSVLKAEELDMDEYLYGHVSDAYEWHLTTFKGHHVSIPLPVILYSRNSGWHCFL